MSGGWECPIPLPCSCSSSHPQSQSLDRHPRSPSRHRLERRVSFLELEVELDPSERPYRGPWGCSFRIHLEESDGVPLSAWRQETVHPPEMPIAYPDVRGGGLPVWPFHLEHWSMAGLAGPPVGHATLVGGTHCHPWCEEPKEASPEICASFLILVVRC